MFITPFATAVALQASGPTNFYKVIVMVLVEIPWLAWLARRLFCIITKRRNAALGFYGERAVAEELNQLMLDGCRVFHDVPMEPYGNIDHVIVSRTGVYAVETKTRRKRPARPGKHEFAVVFNGKELEFAHCIDTHGIEQSRQQADRLRSYLTKAVGEPIAVSPILTLPGWMVTSRVNSKMRVVNPKAIRHVVIRREGWALSEQLMQRVAHQLDQKCRDVEL